MSNLTLSTIGNVEGIHKYHSKYSNNFDKISFNWPWIGRYPGIWFSYDSLSSKTISDIDNGISYGNIKSTFMDNAPVIFIEGYDLTDNQRSNLINSKVIDFSSFIDEKYKTYEFYRKNTFRTIYEAGYDIVVLKRQASNLLDELIIFNIDVIKKLEILEFHGYKVIYEK